MKIRQGIDIISIRKIQNVMERQGRNFIRRIFTPREQRYCESKRMKYEHYAARFAAKEAAMKAFEIRQGNQFRFRAIEIRRQATGKPFIYLPPQVYRIFSLPRDCQIELSMTHERQYAMACVLLILP